MSEANSDDNNDRYDALIAHRIRLADQKSSQIVQFDKSLLYMSGAALSFSMIFIEKFGGVEEVTVYIVLSWAFLASSILINLISYKLSYLDADFEMRRLDFELRNLSVKEFINEEDKNNNICRTLTFLANILSFLFFTLGVFSFIAHAIVVANKLSGGAIW